MYNVSRHCDKKTLVVILCIFLITVIVYIPFKELECHFSPQYNQQERELIANYSRLNLYFDTFTNLVAGKNNRVYQYNRSSPLIFISGVDSYSGVSLLRRLLNSHPDINCGHERHLISMLLMVKDKTYSTHKETNRLELAGVGPPVFYSGIAAFILEIMSRQVQPAEHLCNEDFHSATDAYFLANLFPLSRFVLVVRDGRAVAHSRMAQSISDYGSEHFNSTLFEEYVKKWNTEIRSLLSGCRAVGRYYCVVVYYEHLILRPVQSMNMILEFLGVPFPRYRDEENSMFFDEIKQLHETAQNATRDLTSWADFATNYTFELQNTTHVLAKLGYLNLGSPPNYNNLNPKKYLDTRHF